METETLVFVATLKNINSLLHKFPQRQSLLRHFPYRLINLKPFPNLLNTKIQTYYVLSIAYSLYKPGGGGRALQIGPPQQKY